MKNLYCNNCKKEASFVEGILTKTCECNAGVVAEIMVVTKNTSNTKIKKNNNLELLIIKLKEWKDFLNIRK